LHPSSQPRAAPRGIRAAFRRVYRGAFRRRRLQRHGRPSPLRHRRRHREGDLVITTPFSFVASANVILYERAIPVFVDIDPLTLNISPEQAPRPSMT
jgi:hypothetical protein